MNKLFFCLVLGLFISSCDNAEQVQEANAQIETLKAEIDSLRASSLKSDQSIATFFTFQKGNAEEAMNFYVETFPNSEVLDLQKWGKDMPSPEGTVMHATFTLDGNLFMCSDSPPVHEWGFTPAVSNFVECTSEEQLKHYYDRLSDGGTVMMPIDNYGFSQQFAFVEDQFGVSWQLNLK